MRTLKIILSVLFILAVSFLVVKSCVRTRPHVSGADTGYHFFQTKAKKPVKIKTAPKAPAVSAKTPSAPSVPPVSGKTSAKMAIILDDWGKNRTVLADAIALDRPITLAILPKLVHSEEIAQQAHDHGLGVMLHMPMEPESRSQPLEPQTILTTTPDKEVARYLREALDSIPHVEGANNHMGSKATSDARIMKIVLTELKKKKLFFIDSHVINTSKGLVTAKETGILFAQRDVFIDNVVKVSLIKVQLSKAIKIALSRGSVVVIGHDKKPTLQAISEMIPEIERAGVRLVYARDLVQKAQ